MSQEAAHRSTKELEAQLNHILAAPEHTGRVEMIVARPDVDQRETVGSGRLSTADGLVGDNWRERGSGSTADGSADPMAQITIMNARAAQAVAGTRDRWALAGDQIYVDMDISRTNMPAGTRLRIGEAVVEISPTPHAGCAKFAKRFGKEALRFVNVGEGKAHRLRGANAFVVEDGDIAVGDRVSKVRS